VCYSTEAFGGVQLFQILILHKWIEHSKHSEGKGIKKGLLNFHPSVYGWEGVCLSRECHSDETDLVEC
jgi:hypothetical protein